ncbi:MAG: branched-chain amino acid ABC transporter permease [Alphaproteobacteria bacterium]|nr:branched-chain amino acid ABC transporter permease [Alphaproteobacteria bacterium]
MPRQGRVELAVLALAVLALAAFPLVAESYYLRLVTRIMVTGLFAMSLDLLVGYAGLVSLGHAAFYGAAAYTVGLIVNKLGITDVAVLLPASLAVAAVFALAIGALSIRTSGVYFIMITLALAQMLYYFVKDRRDWGGTDGMNVDSKPTMEWFGVRLFDFYDRTAFYYLVLACLVGAFVLLSVMLAAPFGRVLVGIKANEARTRALGYDVQRVKLVAFVIAGTLAGLAGFLEAARATFVNPQHLAWHESGHLLVIVILGGMGTLWGPVLGAFVVIFLEDWLSTLTDRVLLVMGAFVLAVVLFLPQGIAGLFRRPAKAPPESGDG